MEADKQKRQNCKGKRDSDLLIEYNAIIASYGETARYIAKSRLYAQVAEKFHIMPDSARNILQRMMRQKSKPNGNH